MVYETITVITQGYWDVNHYDVDDDGCFKEEFHVNEAKVKFLTISHDQQGLGVQKP